MNDETSNVEGALIGAATAAALGFARSDDETQRRLRRNQQETHSVGNDLRALTASGAIQRLNMAVVQDAICGISIANQGDPVPTLTPSNVQITRPDIAANMMAAVLSMSWPPRQGQYNNQGYIEQIGELTAMFASLTYEEVRAIVMGLVQSAQPSEQAKAQCYNMANALVSTLYKLDLTKAQYAEIWAKLFGLVASTSAQDPHSDPNQAPRIVNIDASIASVTPLGTPHIAAYPYATWNTDYANKWRVTVSAAGAPASTNIFSVQFGSEFRKPAPGGAIMQSYQPVVTSQTPPHFIVQSTTSVGFTVKTGVALAASAIFDVGFGAFGG